MFNYETDGRMQGLLLSYDGIYNYELSAYSVDKSVFKKELRKRRFIGSAIAFSIIAIPSFLLTLDGEGHAFGVFLLIIAPFILLIGGLDELIKLFKKDSVLFKYSNGHDAGYAYRLQNTDQRKIYHLVFSKIFADNGNTMFWFKLFNLKDESLLREATEIMLAEQELIRIINKSNDYQNTIDSSDESEIALIGKSSQDRLLILEEKFNEFKEEVMNAAIDHNFDIDEIMKMVVKVSF